MVVVGADGKTKTVLQTSPPPKKDTTPNLYQYKVPISKYNTLHSVATRRQQRPRPAEPVANGNGTNGRWAVLDVYRVGEAITFGGFLNSV